MSPVETRTRAVLEAVVRLRKEVPIGTQVELGIDKDLNAILRKLQQRMNDTDGAERAERVAEVMGITEEENDGGW